MNDVRSGAISFDRYEVNEITFRLNPNYDGEEVTVAVDIGSEFQIDDSEKSLVVKLMLDVFHDAEKNGYPFELKMLMTGYFTKIDESDEIKRFQTNALAILFPYARAIVSTYTASANITPLILPTFNINQVVHSGNER